MATVRVTCSDCGEDSKHHTFDVTVLPGQAGGPGRYVFTCPHCRVVVSKPAEARTVDLLVASGCRTADVTDLARSVWQVVDGGIDDMCDGFAALLDDDRRIWQWLDTPCQ